jgi:hypothetical protein
MNKIAEHIIEEDNTLQSYRSVKFGVCKAFSELGLSPKNAEQLLEKIANGIKIDPVELIKQYSLFLVGTGAAAGVGTAMLRRKMDKSIAGTDTQEIRNTKAKVDAYKKMIQDIKYENNFTSQEGQGIA